MHDLAFECSVQRLAERKPKHFHVLFVGLRAALRLGQLFGEEQVRAAGETTPSEV